MTFWGVTDRHSWIDARFGSDDPLLFDEDCREKPAYLGVRDAIAALASTGAATGERARRA